MQAREMLQAHPQKPPMSLEEIVSCIEECYSCAQICKTCADACLGEEQIDRLRKCIRLNLSCAAICETTGGLMSMPGDMNMKLTQQQMQACVTACEVCGEECRRHAEYHEHCRICADECDRCAEVCRSMMTAGVSA
ncbi:MAG: four-helix bundle copper-binding protein [Armatimonadota bacterium]